VQGQPWTVQANRDIVLTAIDTFGAERCLFASNFPVDSLCASFDQIFEGFAAIVQDFSPAARSALFHDNAVRLYAIPFPSDPQATAHDHRPSTHRIHRPGPARATHGLAAAAAGLCLVVWNREPERCAPLVAAGAVQASIAGRRGGALRHRVPVRHRRRRGARRGVRQPGPRAGAAHRRTLLDFSTVTPDKTRDLALRARAIDLHWIDAPVSGGPAAAASGSLTLMFGGAAGDVAAVEPLLQAVASRRTHVGDVGSGQEMKVVNQALVGARQ
jgi:hypothetical protein